MSNRILKAGVCRSDTIAKLDGDWAAEVLFYRIMVGMCDDFGRFDARLAIIRAECYPLAVDEQGNWKVSLKDIGEWLSHLSDPTIGLIQLYSVDGHEYGAMSKWDNHQRIRNQRSKYPEPPETNLLPVDSNCGQMPANDALNPNPNPNPNPNGNPNENKKEALNSPAIKAVLDWFSKAWSKANGGAPYPTTGGYVIQAQAAKRLLKQYPDYETKLSEQLALALRAGYWAKVPGSLCDFTKHLGDYVEAKRKRDVVLKPSASDLPESQA